MKLDPENLPQVTMGTMVPHPTPCERCRCPWCKRTGVEITLHHLTPKEYGGKELAAICRDCHRAVHTVFSNKELRDHYHTKAALFAHDGFRRMIIYIAKQDPGGKVRFPKRKRR